MTVITKSNIPDSACTSLETLASWAILALARCNPELEILEIEGSQTRAIQLSLLIDDTGTPRLVSRLSLPLTSNYAEDNSVKLWAKTQQLSTVALPSGFTS